MLRNVQSFRKCHSGFSGVGSECSAVHRYSDLVFVGYPLTAEPESAEPEGTA